MESVHITMVLMKALSNMQEIILFITGAYIQ